MESPSNGVASAQMLPKSLFKGKIRRKNQGFARLAILLAGRERGKYSAYRARREFKNDGALVHLRNRTL